MTDVNIAIKNSLHMNTEADTKADTETGVLPEVDFTEYIRSSKIHPGTKAHPKTPHCESRNEFNATAIREGLIPGSTEYLKAKHMQAYKNRKDFNGYGTPPVPLSGAWVNLFPPLEKRTCVTAAIILGLATDGHLITAPQMKIWTGERNNSISSFQYHHTLSSEWYNRVWAFGNEIHVQNFRIIMRTAFAAGLRDYGWTTWNTGGYLPTRTEPFTVIEWLSLLTKAGICPKRPDVIPQEVYSELDKLNIVPIKEFTSA